MSPDDPGREDIRARLACAEKDPQSNGYVTERSTAHCGYQASSQLFGEETLLLILGGQLIANRRDQELQLGPGDHLHVPAGVPYRLRVTGETTVDWIQAHRSDRIGERLTRSEKA